MIGHQGPIQSLAFSPTGDLLASASSDCSIRLWDTASRTLVGRVPAHNEQIRTIDFRADGKVLISGGDDGVIKLWDVHSILEASGKTVRSLQTLSAPGPYTGMKIAGVQGITAAQQEALKALGAVAE